MKLRGVAAVKVAGQSGKGRKDAPKSGDTPSPGRRRNREAVAGENFCKGHPGPRAENYGCRLRRQKGVPCCHCPSRRHGAHASWRIRKLNVCGENRIPVRQEKPRRNMDAVVAAKIATRKAEGVSRDTRKSSVARGPRTRATTGTASRPYCSSFERKKSSQRLRNPRDPQSSSARCMGAADAGT